MAKRPTRAAAWLPPRALIGMIHLPPLPGSSRSALPLDRIEARALAEAELLARSGFHAVMIENFGDAPFRADAVAPITIAAMTAVVRRVAARVSIPVGVNVLRNDGLAALAVAAAAGATFVRVNVLSGVYATDQGLISGRAADLLAARAAWCPRVRIAADVHVKHATPINQPDLAEAAEETAYRAGADALVVSGPGTGKATHRRDLEVVRRAVPDRPLWVGSGATADTAAGLFDIADALIVGTSLKRGGRTESPLDAARTRAFMKAAGRRA